jgi:hypothetical protein
MMNPSPKMNPKAIGEAFMTIPSRYNTFSTGGNPFPPETCPEQGWMIRGEEGVQEFPS